MTRVYLAIKQASCSLTPHSGEISFKSAACFKILRLARITECQSTAGVVCTCVCARVKRVDTSSLCGLRSDCINMIDSINGVIIPHIRHLKSFISQSCLDNQSLENTPSFSSVHSAPSFLPFFPSVSPLLHIQLSLALFLSSL